MSKYTTGELAKRCGVTVRTVQYYDTRGILVPSELSEGGRRLYSEEDLKRIWKTETEIYQAIAKKLGMSPKAVDNAIQRIRRKVREQTLEGEEET